MILDRLPSRTGSRLLVPPLRFRQAAGSWRSPEIALLSSWVAVLAAWVVGWSAVAVAFSRAVGGVASHLYGCAMLSFIESALQGTCKYVLVPL